jgi:hypothetical protein
VQKNPKKNTAPKAPSKAPKAATKATKKSSKKAISDDELEDEFPEEVENDDDVVVNDAWDDNEESFDEDLEEKEQDFKKIKSKEIDEITNFDISKFIHRDDDDDF